MVEISPILQQVKELEQVNNSVQQIRNGISLDKKTYTQESVDVIYSLHRIGTPSKDISVLTNIKIKIVEEILKKETTRRIKK